MLLFQCDSVTTCENVFYLEDTILRRVTYCHYAVLYNTILHTPQWWLTIGSILNFYEQQIFFML